MVMILVFLTEIVSEYSLLVVMSTHRFLINIYPHSPTRPLTIFNPNVMTGRFSLCVVWNDLENLNVQSQKFIVRD